MMSNYQLILFNDNRNSFEDVIIGLSEFAGQNVYQAENCAYIIHYKGHYVIKTGTKREMLKLCDQLTTFGLTVRIQKSKS